MVDSAALWDVRNVYRVVWMAQVCCPTCVRIVRSDSTSDIQLATPFRLVLSRSARRSLRHPCRIVSHRIQSRLHRPNTFRRFPPSLRLPVRPGCLYGLSALYLDIARSFRLLGTLARCGVRLVLAFHLPACCPCLHSCARLMRVIALVRFIVRPL